MSSSEEEPRAAADFKARLIEMVEEIYLRHSQGIPPSEHAVGRCPAHNYVWLPDGTCIEPGCSRRARRRSSK